MKYSILALALLASSAQASIMDVIGPINRYVNDTVEYVTDGANGADYWQTREETSLSAQGDCEDFAIYKYEMLRDLGIEAHLAYGANSNGTAHMVTIVDGYVLDNETDTVLTLEETSFKLAFLIDVQSQTAFIDDHSVKLNMSQLSDYINRSK